MIQQRQFCKEHEDSHYAAAIFRYEREYATRVREHSKDMKEYATRVREHSKDMKEYAT